MKNNTRDVAPQWGAKADGGGNLGDWTVGTVEFDGETTKEMDTQVSEEIAEKVTNGEMPQELEIVQFVRRHPAAVAELLNGQCHIKFSGPTLKAQVETQVEAAHKQLDTENYKGWLTRTYTAAREVAKQLFPTATVDFPALVAKWAAERKAPKEKALPEEVLLIRTKWDASQKQTQFLALHGLDAGLVGKSALIVEQAWMAKHRASKADQL